MERRSNAIRERLESLGRQRLGGMRRGIEKESLRVLADGRLALTPHPQALGAALTHPRITTDFSESQLELITGVHAGADACLDELARLHQFVYRSIGDEMLWVASMPCGLPADETIPIARYGRSNIGRAKSVYRAGLGHRYGRRMQTICGLHYNWSLPGLTSDDYFALIRNFRRHSFLLLLLFGASPAVCPSFLEGRQHALQPLGGQTLGLPHATSLRMGRLGYQSDAQAGLAVSYNSLERYATSLQDALTRTHPAYEAIGVRSPGGEYAQLATTLLQIENEFYGTIRPKRSIESGERPLHALRSHGVEYVEIRCLDLDPFEPVGISAQTIALLDVLLLHCTLSDSPDDTPDEIAALARNQERTAARGREPGLRLERRSGEIALVDWAAQVLDECEPIAAALDALHGEQRHRDALRAARRSLAEPERLPSARVLAAMAREFDGSHVRFVLAQSEAARRAALQRPWPSGFEQECRAMAEASLAAQQAIEAADTEPFEAWRQKYLDTARIA